MFDFAWSEIALIAAVALVVIGPKDLPIALRAISGFVKKARRMAGEFQTHVDEMMRDADLKDVKDSFNQIRNFDFRSTVEKAIDPDHTLRDTFSGNPTGYRGRRQRLPSPSAKPPPANPPPTSMSRNRCPDRPFGSRRPRSFRPLWCRSWTLHCPPSHRHPSFRRLPFMRPPCSNARQPDPGFADNMKTFRGHS